MKNFKIYLIALLASVFMVSCLVDDEIDSNDKSYENAPNIIGFPTNTTLANFVENPGAIFPFNIPVEALGGASGQASNLKTEFTYEVGELSDLNLTAEQITEIEDNQLAAVEGVQFDFVDNSKLGTIQGSETFTQIPINVYNDTTDAGSVTYFVLNITQVVTNGENVVVSSQLKSTLVQIQLCRIDLAGSYTDPYGDSQTVTMLSPGLYRASYLPPFSSTYTFDFTACAGELTIIGWQFNETNSDSASYYITQGVPGYVGTAGELIFEKVNMTDISFYVNRDFTFTKN
jgi:hypothetical protein